ncbi:MAG: DUF445 family protein, partial [Halobacteria archaeon]|nr:DUF445 family protein [Halobacteria archaeon]
DIIQREHPELWEDAPDSVKRIIHQHVESRLPEVADRLFERTGENIDDLMSVKMMIINHLEANPKLLNRMFLEVGDKELKFLVNSGFIFGTLLGFISIPLFVFIDRWWVLPVSGALVGYMTNFIAIKAIFRPVNEYKVGPFRIQGLFIKRQDESVEKYASIVAKKVLTVGNIARHLLYGPKSDRTRKMIRDSLRPEIDKSVGAAQPIVRATTGDRSYEKMRESLATEPIEFGYELLKDPEFNRERSVRMKELIAKEMKKLPPEEYVKMLRPAFEEDEWLLIAVGAVLGFVAGWIQLLVVTDQDGSTGFRVELLNLDSSTRLSDIEELLYSLETAVVEGRIDIKEGERVLEEVWAAAFPASPVEGRFGSLSLVDSMSLETRDMPSGVPDDDESRSLVDAIRDAIWLVRIAATT